MFQPFADVLPYEIFSIRLLTKALPDLPLQLQRVSTVQYRRLVENMLRYSSAFQWDADGGADGRGAFLYTVASLRRRYLNMRALLY